LTSKVLGSGDPFDCAQGRLIDSCPPARSPATLAGLTVYLAVPDRSVLSRHAAFRRAVLRVGHTI